MLLKMRGIRVLLHVSFTIAILPIVASGVKR